jgi:hypothetical protein
MVLTIARAGGGGSLNLCAMEIGETTWPIAYLGGSGGFCALCVALWPSVFPVALMGMNPSRRLNMSCIAVGIDLLFRVDVCDGLGTQVRHGFGVARRFANGHGLQGRARSTLQGH